MGEGGGGVQIKSGNKLSHLHIPNIFVKIAKCTDLLAEWPLQKETIIK